MIAEIDGKTVAMAITIPDINQVLKKMSGRLLPLGLVVLPAPRNRIIDRLRVGFLGVLPEYEHTGVAAALYLDHFDVAEQQPPEARRGELHPRDQHLDEPRPGGDGRADREALAGLRADARARCRAVGAVDRRVTVTSAPLR